MVSKKIICKIEDSLDIKSYRIIIKDKDDNILLNTISKDGLLLFQFPKSDIYKVVIISDNLYPNILLQTIYIHKTCSNIFYFTFKIKKKPTTFVLTDKYYKNLKIERGEILLE